MNHMTMCVLSYKRKEFLANSIESMIATADEPLEIIVHDDGSDREVTLYLYHLLNNGKISHLILNPPGHNEGQGIALNRMFWMARGDVIVKADQDLVYKPGWSKAIRDTLAANDETCRKTDALRIGALGLFKYHVEPVRFPDTHLEDYLQGGVTYHRVTDFVGSLMAIPRSAWLRFGPFEERSEAFAEDAMFKQQIADTADANPGYGWCLALTPEDYVENVGFGVGPSTLVEGFDENNKGIIAKINPGPKLVTSVRA